MLTSFEVTEHANTGALKVPGFGTRLAVRLGVLMLALGLSGCGGGGSDSAASLDLSVIVEGQPVGGLVVPGQLVRVSMLAGQSVEFDANEPVAWTFTIGDSPLFGNGTTVFVAGLAITQTAVSPSRVVIDTTASGPFPAPVIVNLTATSTIDAAQVALVDLVID